MFQIYKKNSENLCICYKNCNFVANSTNCLLYLILTAMTLSTPTILLSNELQGIQEYAKTRTKNTMTVLFCIQGTIDVEINHRMIHIGTNDLYVRLPSLEVDFGGYTNSHEFLFYQLTIHESLFEQMMLHHFRSEPRWWEKQEFLRKNPVIHLSAPGVRLCYSYFEILSIQLNARQSDYRREIEQSICLAASMEVFNYLDQVMVMSSEAERSSVTQSDYIFHEFMHLMQLNSNQREVQWFAAQLNITPKYLSEVSRARSGKSASEWIAFVTISQIKRQLRHTSLPVNEIAKKMQFPNASFFCQYTKKHTGLTPNQIRTQRYEQNQG